MAYIFVGLGNPGQEYEDTRHNVGRIVLDYLQKKYECSDWKLDKKLNALVSKGVIGKKEKVTLIKPETFMNKSGNSVGPVITSVKKAKTLVVVHDDLDLPLGRLKISFNKSSGGHRGVESIIKSIKTQEFIRVRVGISPANAKGEAKKPQGEEAVGDFIIAPFKPKELEEITGKLKSIAASIEILMDQNLQEAMMIANQNH